VAIVGFKIYDEYIYRPWQYSNDWCTEYGHVKAVKLRHLQHGKNYEYSANHCRRLYKDNEYRDKGAKKYIDEEYFKMCMIISYDIYEDSSEYDEYVSKKFNKQDIDIVTGEYKDECNRKNLTY
jgi:hypothetical protein